MVSSSATRVVLVLLVLASAFAAHSLQATLKQERKRDAPTTYNCPPNMLGKYTEYHHGWSSPVADDVLVTFEAKGPYGDLRINLSPQFGKETCRDVNSCFEVTLGSDGNKFVDINNESFVWAPISNGNMLGPDWTPFYVSLHNAEFVVGYGNVPYRNVVASVPNKLVMKVLNWGKEPMPWQTGLKYVSFASWEEPVQLRKIKVSRSYIPRQTKGIIPFTVRNSPWIYEIFPFPGKVSSTDLLMFFDVQSLGGLMMAFLPDREFFSEEQDAYEIVLGMNYDRGSVMRWGTATGKQLGESKDQTTRIFSASPYKPMWLHIKDGVIAVGFGRQEGEDILMTSAPDEKIPMISPQVEFSVNSEAFASVMRLVAVRSDGKWYLDHRSEDSEKDLLDENDVVPLTMETRQDEPFVPYRLPKLPQSCPPMERCTTPQLKNHKIMDDVPSRYQWWTDGAYCGEVAIQSAAMYHGAYLSQLAIRNVAPQNGYAQFFNSDSNGNEVMHTNMGGALTSLGFNYEMWDDKNAPRPQAPGMLRWMKKHLVAGNPVLWYLLVGAGPFYDHIQSVFGYSSDHPLSDPIVYDSDQIGAATGYDLMRRWRTVNTLYDSSQLGTRFGWNKENNNCTKGWHTECLPYNQTWAFSISGIVDPLHRSIPTSVNVDDAGMEPMSRVAQNVTATVKVRGPLTPGRMYRIMRWDNPASFPRDSLFEASSYTLAHSFTAQNTEYKWSDPVRFLSTSTVYYVTVAVEDFNLNGHIVRETPSSDTVISQKE